MLTAADAGDELYRLLQPVLRRAVVLLSVLAAGLLLAIGVGDGRLEGEEFLSSPLWQADMRTVQRELGAGETVYLTFFNGLGYFWSTHDRQWRFAESVDGRCQRFVLAGGRGQTDVLWDHQWFSVPAQATDEFLARVERLAANRGQAEIWVLSMDCQFDPRLRSSRDPFSSAAPRFSVQRRVELAEGALLRVRVGSASR